MKLGNDIAHGPLPKCLPSSNGHRPHGERTDAPDRLENLVDFLLAGAEESPRIEGVVVGTLTGFDDAGAPLVEFALNADAEPLPARATIEFETSDRDREVALLFEEGDLRKPIVIGLMWEPGETPAESPNEHTEEKRNIEVSADGEYLSLTAEREIVLRCGKASITLTRAGKVLIKGTFVLTDSSGVNRIRGGSVQIN